MDKILFNGITTNNLKRIFFQLEKNKITTLVGPSGSGKSSLAYDTVFSICHNDFEQLSSGSDHIVHNYRIEHYENIIPAIAIHQENYNTNPRSVILTYSNLNHILSEIIAYCNPDIKSQHIPFTSPINCCKECDGLGSVYHPDYISIVDNSIPISELPFLSWRAFSSNHYLPLLLEFCHDQKINTEKKISELNKQDLVKILWSQTSKQYKIRFRQKKSYRTKNLTYTGPLREMQDLCKALSQPSNKVKAEKYIRSEICPSCKGSRVDKYYKQYHIGDYEFPEFITSDILEIYKHLKSKQFSFKTPAIKTILSFLKALIYNRLEYLHLSRSIPSLSGGELQRLRLALVSRTSLSNILFVADELSAHLHPSEYQSVFNQIRSIVKQNNTVLLVEHNEIFTRNSDNVVFIGPGAGKAGGKIIEKPDMNKLDLCRNSNSSQKMELMDFGIVSANNVKDLPIKLPKNLIIGFCGVSGSGKSTVAKELSSNQFVIYSTQRPVKRSYNSTVATYTDILDSIRDIYSKKTRLPREMFSLSSKGACPKCSGSGYMIHSQAFGDTVRVQCTVCEGKRFCAKTLSATVDGISIDELLCIPLEEFSLELPSSASNIVKNLINLRLGYLGLGRETNTLSGGELQRLKLVRYLQGRLKNKFFILDEPTNGIGDVELPSIWNFIEEIADKSMGVVIIEHNPKILQVVDYFVEFGPGSGRNGGKIIYQGKDFMKTGIGSI